MAIDLEHFLRLDLNFPGITFEYESRALDVYLRVLEEQVSHAQAQYRLRAERRLEKMKPSLDRDEYREISLWIDDAANHQIPQFFSIGAIASIWGLFESFLVDFATYVGGRENTGLPFRDIRANNFRHQVEKYFEGMHRIPLPWSEQERESLSHLQELRNVVAHRNGRVTDLPAEVEAKFKTLVGKLDGVKIVDDRIAISSIYISNVAELISSLVSRLSQQLADRYAPRGAE